MTIAYTQQTLVTTEYRNLVCLATLYSSLATKKWAVVSSIVRMTSQYTAYIADSGNARVSVFTTDGQFCGIIGQGGLAVYAM